LQSLIREKHSKLGSDPKTIKDSFQTKDFAAANGLNGVCVSYTERSEKDGKTIDLRSYSYLVKNNQGRCVAVSYIAAVQQDSDSIHQMILKSLRLE
jgi:hypothetical protein